MILTLPSGIRGKFRIKELWKEIAPGTGFGLRYACSYIVTRAGLGIPLHAPCSTGKSGYYNIRRNFRNGFVLNLTIGYPFWDILHQHFLKDKYIEEESRIVLYCKVFCSDDEAQNNLNKKRLHCILRKTYVTLNGDSCGVNQSTDTHHILKK